MIPDARSDSLDRTGLIDADGSLAGTGAATSSVPVVGPLTPAELQLRIDGIRFAFTPYDFTMNTSTAAPRVLTYRFETSAPADVPSSFAGYTYTPFTEAQKTAVRAMLAEYATVINISFVEMTAPGDADISLGRGNLESFYGGRGQFSTQGLSHDGWVLWNVNQDLTLASKRELILHELGHAFSLKHAGNYDVNPNVKPTGPFLNADEDNQRYTVMSYNDNPDIGGNSDDLMIYDIAALQSRWGANLTYRTGNDTYTGVPTGQKVMAVWDAGGTNTFDASTRTTPVVLDLRQGSFSTFDRANDVSIAYGTVIQNAKGGAGNDWVIGNDSSNVVDGGPGVDSFVTSDLRATTTITNVNGVVTLKGKAGTDVLTNIETIVFGNGETVAVASLAGQPAGNMGLPAAAVTLFVTGGMPSASEYATRTSAAKAAYDYYAGVLKVANPDIGPYESLGVSFSQLASFQAKYAPGVLSDTAFITSAYQDAFLRAPTGAQVTAFQQQITYFTGLYTSAGISAANAALQARGAVVGQMVGYVMTDPTESGRAGQTLDDRVATFVAGQAASTSAPDGLLWV